MIAVASLVSIVAGAALAYAAERYPVHIEKLQTGGGVLLVAGLMLIGSGISHA